MNVLWGIVMMAIGVSFLYWGSTQSDSVVYRLLAARSKILWGERVHRFYQIAGAVLVVLGLLWAIGVIW